MTRDKTTTGSKGEQMAEDFLRKKGYTVRARNYRFRHAEIDLVVQKDDLVVFVEVKTRRSSAFGEPETFVGFRKAEKVMEAAEHFVFSEGWTGAIRFDIVAIKLEDEARIMHFEDAFH